MVLDIDGGYKQPEKIWNFGGIYGTFPISSGTTTTVLFKTTSGTAFDIGFHMGAYDTESIRRFSFKARGICLMGMTQSKAGMLVIPILISGIIFH